MSIAEFKKYYWVNNLENKIDYINKYNNKQGEEKKITSYLRLLRNEISQETAHNKYIDFKYIDKLYPEKIDAFVMEAASNYVRRVNKFYIKVYNRANDERDNIIRSYQKSPEEKEEFINLKRDFYNDRLAEFVENSNESVRIVEYKGKLIQKIDPIYLDPEHNLVKAHFYAPQKKIFGVYYSTFWVNTMVIWFMSLLFYLVLYFRGLKNLLDFFSNTNKKHSASFN
jgi:hypothetical protein